MARNEEKQYGRLNRLILKKEKDARDKLHPKRPHLSSLHSVDEIKTWLPSIKRDIDFNLKQSQVICYSDRKVSELQTNVVRLEREYKCFVRKMMDLDSDLTSVPWTDRPYESKRAKVSLFEDQSRCSLRIKTPILDRDSVVEETPLIWNCDRELQDVPLRFETEEKTDTGKVSNGEQSDLLVTCSRSLPSVENGRKGNSLGLDYSDSESD